MCQIGSDRVVPHMESKSTLHWDVTSQKTWREGMGIVKCGKWGGCVVQNASASVRALDMHDHDTQ